MFQEANFILIIMRLVKKYLKEVVLSYNCNENEIQCLKKVY